MILVAQLNSATPVALGGSLSARVVDEHLSHDVRGNPYKMSPIADVAGFLTD
jgi:hypothetical protein